jgi:hypothetical protein
MMAIQLHNDLESGEQSVVNQVMDPTLVCQQISAKIGRDGKRDNPV